MVIDIEEETIELKLTVAKSSRKIRVSASGQVELYDGKNKEWIDLEFMEHIAEKPWNMNNTLGSNTKWIYVEILGERFPVVHLVVKSWHPDYNKGKHMDTLYYKHRDENHWNCSIGNLVVKFL